MMAFLTGSMAGGTQLNITGHGFNNMTDGTMVSVCNLACRVTAVPSSSKLHCVTPAVTLASPGPLPVTPLQVSGSGTSGERSMYPASLMFDGGAGYASEWRYAPCICTSDLSSQSVDHAVSSDSAPCAHIATQPIAC